MSKKIVGLKEEKMTVDVNADGSCPDGFELSGDKSKCVRKESVLSDKSLNEVEDGIDPNPGDNGEVSTAPDENGNCPEGYVLSDDKSKCIKKAPSSERKEGIYDIGHYKPKFVVDGDVFVTLEDSTVLKFEDGENIELCESDQGDLQIGSSKDVLVIGEAKLARTFLESITHIDDIEYQEREVSIEDAIKSGIPTKVVAEEIIRQHKKSNGSLSEISEQSQQRLKIRARRKIRQIRTVPMKVEKVRRENFYKNNSEMISKPKPSSMKKIKTIRTAKIGV
jgi:hypothetical protein